MSKSVEKKALKKHNVLEPFFSGPEDKRTTKIEVNDRLGLMFCSFKRKARVGSDVKIVSLKTGNIVQTIPPQAKYCESSKKDKVEDETFSFLQINRKKMERPADGEDFMERDHVVTFNTIDMESFISDENMCDKVSESDKIHVVTAHASGLLKEWFVGITVSDAVTSEIPELDDLQEERQVISVQLKKTWRSFHQSPMTIVRFSESARLRGFVASGGTSDSTIKVWDLNQGFCTHSLKLKAGAVSCLTFHCMTLGKKATYYLIGSGEMSNSIQIFDLEQSTRVANLEGHMSTVTSFGFLDKTTMLSTSRDKIMITWNLETFTPIKKIPVFESIEDVILRTFGKKTQVAITVGQEGMIKLIEPLTGKVHASAQTSSHGIAFPLKQVLALDDEIISVSDQNHITFHSVVYSGGQLSIHVERQLVGELDQVLSVKYIGDKSEHLVVASNSPLIKIFSLKNRNSCQVFSGHQEIVLNIQVIPWNRNLFISSSKDNSVKIWRFSVNEEKCSFDACILYSGSGHFRPVTAVCIANKVTSDFFISGSEDSIVKVWKTPSSVFDDESDANSVQSLISLSSLKAHEKDVNSISISPNDQLVATGSKDKTCKVWSIDLKTKQMSLLTTLRGHKKTIWSTDFSPVDKILLTASADCSIRIWSLSDFACLRTMSGDNSSVYVFAKFMSNGTQVIASSTDALIRVFSVKTAELTLTVDPVLHAQVVTDMNQTNFKAVKKNQITEDSNAEDNNDDDQRIWTLDFDSKEEHLVFGSGSRIFIFEDCTSAAKHDFLSKKDSQIVFDQKLQNLLKDKKYGKALKVAINLDQPGRCLDILRQVSLSHPGDDVKNVDEEDASEKVYGFKKLEKLLESLRDDQLFYLMKLASLKWNTNSRHCMLAQMIMKTCLPRIIKELLDNDFNQDMSSLTNMVEAMICFTERHETRMRKQCVSSQLINFLSQDVMKALPVQDLSLEEKEEVPARSSVTREEPRKTRNEPMEVTVDDKEEPEQTEEDDFGDLSSGEETELPQRRILGELSEKQQKKKLLAKMKAMKETKARKRKTHNR